MRITAALLCSAALLAAFAAPAAVRQTAAAPAAQSPAQTATEVVPWEKAGDYLGKQITVEGVIVDTKNSNKSCFLNFSKTRDSFYVVVFEPALTGYDVAPAEKFRGKKIRVSGTVTQYKERPQIQVKQTTQIVIVEETRPAR